MRLQRLATPALGMLAIGSAEAQVATPARVENLASNAAIGAFIGASRALMAHKSLVRGAVRGAAGGGFAAGARQFAGTARFPGAGLTARLLGGMGTGLVASAASDSTSLYLPVGPFVGVLQPGSSDRFRWKIDVGAAAYTLGSAMKPHTRVKLGASLSSGAIVLERGQWIEQRNGLQRAGTEAFGRVILATEIRNLPLHQQKEIAAHELIHVMQEDAAFLPLTVPAEREVLRHMPGGRWWDGPIGKHLEINLVGRMAFSVVSPEIDYSNRPWEREAYKLTGAAFPEILRPHH